MIAGLSRIDMIENVIEAGAIIYILHPTDSDEAIRLYHI